jgi:hypothetical protein
MIKLLPAQLLGRAFQPGSDRAAFLRAELLKLVQAIGVVGVFHEFVGELSIVRTLNQRCALRTAASTCSQ